MISCKTSGIVLHLLVTSTQLQTNLEDSRTVTRPLPGITRSPLPERRHIKQRTNAANARNSYVTALGLIVKSTTEIHQHQASMKRDFS